MNGLQQLLEVEIYYIFWEYIFSFSYGGKSHGGWDLPLCEREKYTPRVPNNNPLKAKL